MARQKDFGLLTILCILIIFAAINLVAWSAGTDSDRFFLSLVMLIAIVLSITITYIGYYFSGIIPNHEDQLVKLSNTPRNVGIVLFVLSLFYYFNAVVSLNDLPDVGFAWEAAVMSGLFLVCSVIFIVGYAVSNQLSRYFEEMSRSEIARQQLERKGRDESFVRKA